ncbi:hypothetical protein QJS10_CPB17g01026 [Acorus calamus]|uniref:Uncharacterized protein n=1 Tax=Acorus calamus TaxID=4465 RepID=A0AAV9CWH1_ACOCL|nr:hypothetical protein QJS10_CPB17g01026 [Acorus calamus]
MALAMSGTSRAFVEHGGTAISGGLSDLGAKMSGSLHIQGRIHLEEARHTGGLQYGCPNQMDVEE